MRKVFPVVFMAFQVYFIACSQPVNKQYATLVGECEGCEGVFEYGNKSLFPVDTLPDFREPGPKIKVTGTVYLPDGKTPARNVILYVYHTNQKGIYENKYGENNWERRHGYIRGWMKTGKDGRYAFYTLKPGTYPDRSEPVHIHITILEPDGKYYWLGSYHFEGDPLLTKKERTPVSPRGGSSGIISLKKEGEIHAGERDLILGKNVPGYDLVLLGTVVIFRGTTQIR